MPRHFLSPPSWVCVGGVSGGSAAAGGRKSDESLGACASPPHPLWALAGSTSLRAGMRREAPGTERQVSLGAQSSPERSASGSQGGPPEGSGSRKASDTGLGPSRVHLPHPQVVTVEVTLSLALSLAPSASPGGQAEQGRGAGWPGGLFHAHTCLPLLCKLDWAGPAPGEGAHLPRAPHPPPLHLPLPPHR